MRRVLLCVAFLTSAAHAQDALAPAPPELIQSEARYLPTLEGPQPGVARGLTIWRAPSTPGGVLLPTLYMADGERGVYLVAARLRQPIEDGLIPPIQIVGIDPDPRHRTEEYGRPGRARFRAHERWVLETVIPWAERVARASPEQRAIGGYSNGADFALAMAEAHPDVFTAVLAHSPLTTEVVRINADGARIRWAVSAGRMEMNGRAAYAMSVVESAAASAGARARICSGTWGHDYESWLDLTPGAVAWMFGFDVDVATPLERGACRVR